MRADACIKCGADFRGEPIPQEYIDKGYYRPESTHYRREIGHEIPGVYDGVLYWSCPDCGWAWPRDFGKDWGRVDASERYVEIHNKEGSA